jgi:clumping factor A
MRKTACFVGLVVGLWPSLSVVAQTGQPFRSYQKGSVRGDFMWIGNTSAQECDARAVAPVVGTFNPGTCGDNVADTAADVFWTSSLDPNSPGVPYADTTVLAAEARSTAVLTLPTGVGPEQILYARLYWAAELPTDTADETVSLDRPGAGVVTVFADRSYSVPKANADGTVYWYESAADVTSVVRSMLSGPYRVGGIDSIELGNFDSDDTFVAWSLVVFYALETEPYRSLSLFEGLNFVRQGSPAVVDISDFKVPYAGYDGKLGIMAFEGDTYWTGDSLYFNDNQLSTKSTQGEDSNPADDFFNGSRTIMGNGVSVVGDLPQFDGRPNSMSGFDLDIVDVTTYLAAGDTSARFRATSAGDTYVLGAIAASIGTFQPDFTDTVKSFANISRPGASVVPGDTIEYTIVARNTGNDDAIETVLTDPLPAGVTYVPGSLYLVPSGAGVDGGASEIQLTDDAGDDQGEYNAAGAPRPTIVVRLGEGATATAGGTVPAGGSVSVRFRVTLDAGVTGPISNQATVEAGGLKGKPTTPFPSGDGETPGQPTETPVAECAGNADCPPARPVCDTSTQLCVECLSDSDCGGVTSGRICSLPAERCADGCRGSGGNGCPSGKLCSSTTTAVGICYVPSTGAGGAGGDAGAGGADGAVDAARDAPMGAGGAGGAGGTGGRRDAGGYDGAGGAGGGPGIDARGVDGRIADGGGAGGTDGAVVAFDASRPADAVGRDLPAGDGVGRDASTQADVPVFIPGVDAGGLADASTVVPVAGVGWSVQGGGCSCSTGARSSNASAALWLAGLAIGLGVRRRRRRRRE